MDDILITFDDCGRSRSLPSHVSNAFFTIDSSLVLSGSPTVSLELSLLDGGVVVARIDGCDLRTALDAAEWAADVSDFLTAPMAIRCILQRATTAGACVRLSGFVSIDEAVCCCFDHICDAQLEQRGRRATVDAFHAALSATEVLPAVFCVRAQPLVLGSSFVRLQEHYECPDACIRGHAFTMDEYRAWARRSGGVGTVAQADSASPYAQARGSCEASEEDEDSSEEDDGSSEEDDDSDDESSSEASHGFDYYLKWPGFNVPSRVLDGARAGVLGPLRPMEEALLAAVATACEEARCNDGRDERGHYVIGITPFDDETMRHEMAHGLWATNGAYRAKVSTIVATIPYEAQEAMRTQLLRDGYADVAEIVEDEVQAYLSEGQLLGCDRCAAVRAAARQIGATFRAYVSRDHGARRGATGGTMSGSIGGSMGGSASGSANGSASGSIGGSANGSASGSIGGSANGSASGSMGGSRAATGAAAGAHHSRPSRVQHCGHAALLASLKVSEGAALGVELRIALLGEG
jgi:hypothetical protein